MGAFLAAESWRCAPVREAEGWGTGVFLDALRRMQVWLKQRENRLWVAGETGAPTRRQGCFLGALCSGGAPSESTPLISGFCPHPPPRP